MKVILVLALIVIILSAGCIGQTRFSERIVPNVTAENLTAIQSNATAINVTLNQTAEENTTQAFNYRNFIPSTPEPRYPLLTKFPMVRSPMPYYVFNRSAVNEYKLNLTLSNLRYAFDQWENATKRKVVFFQVNESPAEGIIIEIVPSLVEFQQGQETIGEAAPYGFVYKNYSLIVGGNMTIFPLYGGAENRVTLVHELGHIMGLGHNSNPHSVLYPYNIYSQEITPDILEALDVLYKDIPVQ